eukprot:546891_1
MRAVEIILFIGLLFIWSLYGLDPLSLKQNPFKNEEIEKRRADHSTRTIHDEFLIFFNEECLDKKQQDHHDMIKEFLDKFECYKKNKKKVKPHRHMGDDYWIVVNRKRDCYDNDEEEIELSDYCITEIDENEEFNPGVGVCTVREVSDDALYNLYSVSETTVPKGVESVNFDGNSDDELNVIVFDTGVDNTHQEFGGINFQRLYDGYPGNNPINFHSHGTHVAATIVGKTYGIVQAKSSNVNLIDVKWADANGFSTLDKIFTALDAVINFLQPADKKAIINHSWRWRHQWGGNFGEINNDMAVIKNLGGINIVAAGNENEDAINSSPSSSPDVITVGAMDQNNNKAGFSNFGNNVDVWAPGVSIKSAIPNNGNALMSGTSMASPLVAGIVANIFGLDDDLSFDDIRNALLENAVNDFNDGQGRQNLARIQASCELYEHSGDQTCYPNNICNSGYMDKTNGNSYYWYCGLNCPGGTYRTDIYCNCACIPNGYCSHPYYEINSYNYNNYYWKHNAGSGTRITLNPSPVQNSQFKIVSSLIGHGDYISFESVNYNGWYLRHSGYALRLNSYDKSDLFRNDASFKVIPSLIGDINYVSFESHNYGGHYLRHSGYQLYIHQNDGSTLFKKDASFRIEVTDGSNAVPFIPDPSSPSYKNPYHYNNMMDYYNKKYFEFKISELSLILFACLITTISMTICIWRYCHKNQQKKAKYSPVRLDAESTTDIDV